MPQAPGNQHPASVANGFLGQQKPDAFCPQRGNPRAGRMSLPRHQNPSQDESLVEVECDRRRQHRRLSRRANLDAPEQRVEDAAEAAEAAAAAPPKALEHGVHLLQYARVSDVAVGALDGLRGMDGWSGGWTKASVFA
jgi:hypothetical protein